MADAYALPMMQATPRTDDPAWQPPRDPLAGARPGIIAREIPIVSTQTHWSFPQVRSALDDLTVGIFDRPAQLCEAILWDPRVQACMASRAGGLFGRPVKFEAASSPRVKGSRAAREVLDAWADAWPTVSNEAAFKQLHSWGVLLFGVAQLLWDTSKPVWVPHVVPFHPRYSYYQFAFRKLIAITLDGQIPIEPGDGHWIVAAPSGYHRGWMRGAMTALAQPWVQRNFAYRDAARYSERHGYPMLKAKVPAAADPRQIATLRNALVNIGQESVLELPQGVDNGTSYDVDYLEPTASTWGVFGESIRLCDMDITLTLLGQNLTTEVKEGSFAAARMHGDVRQSVIESDNAWTTEMIHGQIARPFALINFGDADLAPVTSRDVEPFEDYATAAQTFSSFANALLALRNAGVELEEPTALASRMGIKLAEAKPRAIAPTQVEANVARVEAQADEASDDDAPSDGAKAVSHARIGDAVHTMRAEAPAKYSHIDFTPPKGVREEAEQGLEWRREYGRGGTAVGVARARDLANGKEISPETARRMDSYFARHEVDKKGEGWSPGEDGYPSAGRIAWALWGGDAGQAWAAKLAKQMTAADDKE